MQIRLAQLNDAAEIARLSGELGYSSDADAMALRLEQLLQRPEHLVAVAEGAVELGAGNILLGWIAAEERLILESGERAEIVGLVVASAARRKGVGKALVATVERWALDQDLPMITVRSNVARSAAHPFYECLGYVHKKTQHAYVKSLAPDRQTG